MDRVQRLRDNLRDLLSRHADGGVEYTLYQNLEEAQASLLTLFDDPPKKDSERAEVQSGTGSVYSPTL
jgi:hypothetical protein